MDQELCLVWLYCVIEAALGSMVGTERLRTRGPEPELTDAEVLTLQIWGEMRGLASDAAIWRDATAKLREWFPRLGAEWNFVRRCGNLASVQERLLTRLFGPSGDWNAFDGLPLPVCHNVRAGRDRRFAGQAAWSFCAAKNELYYGFKAGMLMNSRDEIYRIWLGPANVDEREMLGGIGVDLAGRLFADTGLISPELTCTLAGRGVTLVTPLKRNMRETRPQWVLGQAMRLRRRIETAFGRLTDGFAIVRNRGRDFWRWSARVIRKVLAYNLLLRFGRDAAAA
jgi:Transposase DDE domain